MINPLQKDFNKIADRLKQGDRKAGEEIFNYFSPKIFRYFMIRLADREAAQDLSQDVFLKLVGKIEGFNADLGNFSAWFWQIAKNTLIDYYRKKVVLVNIDTVSPYLIAEAQNPIKDGKIEEIMKTINGFSEEEQEVFSLRHLSGLSYN